MTKEERERAIQNAIPRKPVVNKLGGGVYYTCHWAKCNEDLKRYYRYCPMCGTRIDWSDERDSYYDE